MAISKKMNKALNDQVTNEFFASQTYLAMACMFEAKSLAVLAERFRKQALEERDHATKLIDYILDADGTVELQAIPEPQNKYATVQAALEAALEHEEGVTKNIHDLCTLAEADKDRATRQFLDWYVEEQVEEEASARTLIDIGKLCGNAVLQLEAYLIHLMKK
jgi:ferritin